MSNPWLSIPLEDYEGHMGSAEVQHFGALSELFKRALDHCLPESVAVLGIAGGNGLEQIDSSITKRIVGVDVNQQYLDQVRRRFEPSRVWSCIVATSRNHTSAWLGEPGTCGARLRTRRIGRCAGECAFTRRARRCVIRRASVAERRTAGRCLHQLCIDAVAETGFYTHRRQRVSALNEVEGILLG